MDKNHWLLPEGIDEVVPPYAGHLETIRRELLDMYQLWGYDLVIPPFVEYLDSLLTGTGADVDLKTFKLIDQVSGRLMGIRADMTTQVARIDAHHLENEAPARLCYMGTVLHARPDGFGGSRAPLQIGAELYGHAGFESDVEVVSLMLETFARAGVKNVSVDLGHVGIFRGLAADAGLDEKQEAQLFEALQRKAVPEIKVLLDSFSVDPQTAAKIAALSDLNGSDILDQAKQLLADSSQSVTDALENIENVARAVKARYPELPLHYDLAELRGYNFHTGIVFSAYVPQSGVEVARGGRYDNIGGEFGRARPATGFSTDLKILTKYASVTAPAKSSGIMVVCTDATPQDSLLHKTVAALRAQGKRVVFYFPGQAGDAADLGCDQQLVAENGGWQVKPL